jgi:hypothetical protein
MPNLGGWEVDLAIGKFPQKVACALSVMDLVGSTYEPVAYLGRQVVNGVNHAVLAFQHILSSTPSTNLVLMIIHEDPKEKDQVCVLRSVERVLSQSSATALGGRQLFFNTDIPAEATTALEEATKTTLGIEVKPIALLGRQIVKGVNFVLLAETAPVVPDGQKELSLITVNSLDHSHVGVTPLLKSSIEVSLGKPLGEWP